MRLILVIALSLLALPSWANQLKSVRVWPSPDNTRVVLDMSSAPNYNYFTLTGPDRLVIDLKGASNVTNLARIENKSELVRKIRESSPLEKGGLRLVLDLGSTIKPVVFPLAPAGPYGHRLVIDLPYEEKASAAVQATPVGGKGKGVVIAIDPGHGGEDPGSIGPRRTYEKRVTLAVSQKLAALIDREPGMRAVLTRRGDYFVDLNKRSEIARKAKADLLVSVHADSFHNSTPRGASVWVLSTNRANREMGSWLEKQEKQGELLGGVGKVLAESDPNPYLAQTFLDLSMDKSRAEGYDVSRQILRSLGRVARLHKKAPEHASLAVLKAPDIPPYWWRRALSPTTPKSSCWRPPAIRISWPAPSSRGSATITGPIRPRGPCSPARDRAATSRQRSADPPPPASRSPSASRRRNRCSRW
ncbi:N-acetylmuramoyl-L-alanine amidase [Aeromonas hydrophila]|nr:N-acetylmuramoyl-L-alanine amidase [Aeromonas hydrophila]